MRLLKTFNQKIWLIAATAVYYPLPLGRKEWMTDLCVFAGIISLATPLHFTSKKELKLAPLRSVLDQQTITRHLSRIDKSARQGQSN